MKLLEVGYDRVKGGLSDEEMIRKFFVNDPQLASDLNEGGGAYPEEGGVVKVFFPKTGLNGLYQYSNTPIKFICLLGNGTWAIEDEDNMYPAKSLEGVQLHQTVYAQ